MLVHFPSRLALVVILGLEWKNGHEDSYFMAAHPCTSEYTLPISINYWDTTGFVCFFGNNSAYIEVQIVDFFCLFVYVFISFHFGLF